MELRVRETIAMMDDVVIAHVASPERWITIGILLPKYLVATELEKGSRAIRNVGDLPAPLQAEVLEPTSHYLSSSRVWLAFRNDQAMGVAGLKARGDGVAELKRLYVQSNERGGVGRLLMKEDHEYAAAFGFGRIVLDVMESRRGVVEWYRRIGYMETARFFMGDAPMVAMERRVDLGSTPAPMD